jgi:hypothetical protein
VVRGLELFRDRFAAYSNSYVLIGGAASQLVMEEVALSFRATKDLDIVLCVEALDVPFIEAFWEFVKDGGYALKERATGSRQYYRFQKPTNDAYPATIELFSRKPDGIEVPDGVSLTPIPADAEVSSLSAILLDDTYYQWIMTGRRMLEDVPIVGAEHLIPLKARAYLDLKKRRERGEKVDARDVAKHRNDVVRLLQTLEPVPIEGVPDAVREDMREFLDVFDVTANDVKNIDVVFRRPEEISEMLERIYLAAG